MQLKLRPYQIDALEQIRKFYRTGDKKVLLWLATGGGKTLIFSQVLKGVHEKGKKAIMVVRGKSLVEQASQRLDREGVPHGVIQANHPRNRPDEPIQICSIDTLARRRITPEADLIVIDEAHLASSESFKWLVSHYPDAYFLPVTATPFVKSGLRHIADQVVHTITMRELIAQGFLVPPKYFVPSRIDLSAVKIDRRTNDYATASLEEAMSRANIFGDLVKAYREKASGRSAICFAVSIEHSLALRDNFRAHGIRAEHVEANTSQDERDACIKRLRDGELDIICNVGILTTGVDIPFLGCIILARPTKSYNLYIQMLGRGTRIHEGKENFIVLDHVNNIEEHGFIENEAEIDLDGKKPSEKKERVVICGNCLNAFSPLDGYECPECGYDNGPREREAARRIAVEDEAFRMKEIQAVELGLIEQFIEKKIGQARMNRYKPGWVFHKVKDKYGEKVAKKNWRKIKQRLVLQEA